MRRLTLVFPLLLTLGLGLGCEPAESCDVNGATRCNDDGSLESCNIDYWVLVSACEANDSTCQVDEEGQAECIANE